MCNTLYMLIYIVMIQYMYCTHVSSHLACNLLLFLSWDLVLLFSVSSSFLPLSWFCHIDDDIYIIHDNLVNLLSIYDPKNESIYIGRAGSYWQFPRKVRCERDKGSV